MRKRVVSYLTKSPSIFLTVLIIIQSAESFVFVVSL